MQYNNENVSPNLGVVYPMNHVSKKSPKNTTYSILYNNLVNEHERVTTSPR